VLTDRLRAGIRAGVIAAAATAGVLVGFGLARGAALAPLNAVAHMALGSRAHLFDDFDPVVTLTGVMLHTLSIVLWGVLFAFVVWRLPTMWVWIGAALMGTIAYIVDYHLLHESLRPGFERVLSTVEVASVYVVLAAALALGLTLARARDDVRRARDTVSLQNATSAESRAMDTGE
jgi:hypothetical protein